MDKLYVRNALRASIRRASSIARTRETFLQRRPYHHRPQPQPSIKQQRKPYRCTPSRPLTTTSPHLQTARMNARYTPAGDEMTLDLTPRACSRLAAISEKEQKPRLALRITVESGGCHGFQYLMSLADLEDNTDEDTVFEGDEGASVVLDEASLELLNGSTVDYTQELIGSQFKITGNPRAKSSCGCGTSFDVVGE